MRATPSIVGEDEFGKLVISVAGGEGRSLEDYCGSRKTLLVAGRLLWFQGDSSGRWTTGRPLKKIKGSWKVLLASLFLGRSPLAGPDQY